MEAAASDGPMEGLLEKCGTFPQPSHRTLEIAVADARDSHSCLENAVADARVSHSSHRSYGDDLEGIRSEIPPDPEPTRSVTYVPGLECYPCSRSYIPPLPPLFAPCPRDLHRKSSEKSFPVDDR